MLLSLSMSGASVSLQPSLTVLRFDAALLAASAGFALFDLPAPLLPKSGPVEIDLLSALDARRYRVRRVFDAPEHWQVLDCETGWPAASGSADTQHWIQVNLDVSQDHVLPALFRDVVCFSLPATLAWLLDEPGLRERKLADLVRLDRYPVGLRWLDTVVADARQETHGLECALHETRGQDALFDTIRQRSDGARKAALEAQTKIDGLLQQLAQTEPQAQQFHELRAELTDVEQQLVSSQLALATAEAHLTGARQWLMVHERAAKARDDHDAARQEHESAVAEIAKLEVQLADTGVEAEHQVVKGDVLGLEREQSLLQEELLAAQKAESAASDLAQAVQKQQQLDQQLNSAHERSMRLELASRGLQTATADAKRVEVLLADVERQLAEVEQLSPQAARVKKLTDELERQREQLRDANRQVDQLRFLETAIRVVNGHLDDLRKGSSLTERLAVQEGGNGSIKTDERTLVGHLREAIDRQLAALERQLNDWRAQTRDLADAPQRVDQLRSSMYQLQQDVDAARQVELKLGVAPALKQQRKQLHEHFEQLKRSVEAYAKEQRECADAASLASKLKQELGALDDPRARRQALLRQAARKKELEQALREIGKALDEKRKRQAKLEERLAAIAALQQALEAQEQRRGQSAEGHREYQVQQAIVQLTVTAEQDLALAQSEILELREALEQFEARQATLRAALAPIEEMPQNVAALRAQLSEAEQHASELQQYEQIAAAELEVAEQNQERLRQQKAEVERHRRAERLLLGAREVVRQAEVVMGQRFRQELAEQASSRLKCLMDDPDVEMAWPWAEPPVVVTTGGSRTLLELDHADQACCVLAVRLALAEQASRFGAVFVSGLGALLQSPEFIDRLQRLPSPDQLLALPAW